MTTVLSEKPRNETRWNQLEHTKIFPTVVARTGDFETIRKFVAEDATAILLLWLCLEVIGSVEDQLYVVRYN